MARAAVNRSNFNSGIWSPITEGRTDHAKYGGSMRELINCVITPQGPTCKRSGSYMQSETYRHDKKSTLVPYVYGDAQILQLEFSDERLRFQLEEGLQAYTAVAITAITSLSPLVYTVGGGHGTVIGEQVSFSGFAFSLGFNGVVANVVNVVGNTITTDVVYPGMIGSPAGAQVQRIYHIASPYDHEDVHKIRAVQSTTTLYMFCDGYHPRRLTRISAYNWALEVEDIRNGPYLTESARQGRAVLSSSGNPATGGVADADSGTAANAFDGDNATYWEGTSDQTGWVGYEFAAPIAIRGYTIFMAKLNDDTDYASKDYAPGDWTFEASNDGTTWIILDTQNDFLLYQNGRSVHFEVNNATSYLHYRLNITKCTRNGPLTPRVAELVFTPYITPTTTLTISGDYAKLNGGAGFLLSDVGRLVRLRSPDQYWRNYRISGFTSATIVTVQMLEEPFGDPTVPILSWQIGMWSNTTGWPTCGVFFDDRLWVGGVESYPDTIVGTRTGAYGGYLDFAQRTPLNEVLDTSAAVFVLNARRLSRVRWLEADERGLLVGTGVGEWAITPQNLEAALTARNAKARNSSARGAAFVDPVKIDKQIIFVQATQRTIRELAYVLQSDGYRAPSLSLFASHLGVSKYEQMTYAAEPHSIIWFRRGDGSVVGLTYNRDEDVLGWHEHDFAGGFVECVSALPSIATKQDMLWLVVRREVDGETRRYVERLTKVWDFDTMIEEAHFVDAGVRYIGTATDKLYGLRHLEGANAYGLMDGVPFGPIVITNGRLTLPWAAENIVVGRQIVATGEISRPEAGSANGTAQGKIKRVNGCSLLLWASYGGEVTRWNEDQSLHGMGEDVWDYAPIEYPEPFDVLEPITLFSGMTRKMTLPAGYDPHGYIGFRHDEPTPFNLVSMMYDVETQDGG